MVIKILRSVQEITSTFT